MKYRVYENLVFPKIDDSNIVSISGIPKYFAISSNGTQYFENDTLNCIILHRQYICKNVIVRSLSHYPSCVSSIYANKSDMLCQYKKYGNAFELHHIVNTGLLLFSTTGIQVNIICVKDDKISLNQTRVLKGSVFITANTEQFSKEVQLKDMFPTITCCTPFFPSMTDEKTTTSSTIRLTNLQDINKIDSSLLNLNLHKLKMFGKEHFPQSMKTKETSIYMPLPTSLSCYI